MENTIRPTIYKFPPNIIKGMYTDSIDIIDEERPEITDVVLFSILKIIYEKDLGPNREFIYSVPKDALTYEYIMQFEGLVNSLGKAVRLAEYNLGQLKMFLQIYFFYHKFEDVVTRNSNCKKCQAYKIDNSCDKLTFMQMRNIMSCIIKTDSTFHGINSLNSQEKRNKFTKFYEEYITDRDCYTHGEIWFMENTKIPLLRVMLPNQGEQFLKISNETFSENVKLFRFLNSTILEMQRFPHR